jgi:predicted nucleic acid-binding protein
LRFLLDTNIITEVAKPRPNARVLNWLMAHEVASGIPSVAVAERYQGAYTAPAEQRVRLLAEVDLFIREFGETVVPFDAEAARVWGEYVSRPALKLKPRSYPDTQIAAIALSRGLTLVTRNTKDFPEVPVLNPFED